MIFHNNTGWIALFFFALHAPGFAQKNPVGIPADSRQALLVTSKLWDSSAGELIRMEKLPSGKWKPVGEPIPVMIGRNGMAWGRGLHKNPNGILAKKEGDGKAPAGVFTLGTAFGYASLAPPNCQLPWRQATQQDFFVDDKNSPDYNKWVRLAGGVSEAEKRWASFEKMRLENHLYELGIVVNHNMNPVVPGAGSAIFLHIWRTPETPTAGCTAMARENLLLLLNWLKADTKPVLIQAPEGALKIRY